jgi:hypothetical protein
MMSGQEDNELKVIENIYDYAIDQSQKIKECLEKGDPVSAQKRYSISMKLANILCSKNVNMQQ